MKNTLLAATALAACAVSSAGFGQTQSVHSLTGNATVASDYRFRGVSQTFRGPAFQGGFDYAHASGFYMGNWNSNVSGISYPNGAGVEMDFYGGFKKSFGDVGFDVGYLYYFYPSARAVSATLGNRKFDNQEFYVGASWKWISAKVNYSTSNYFGLDGVMARSFFAHRDTGVALPDRGRSRGSMYYDLSINYEVVPKLTLNAHVGRTDVKNYGELDYTDYKLGATYDLNGWLLGAAWVSTNANKAWYYARDAAGKTKQTGTSGAVLSVGKTF